MSLRASAAATNGLGWHRQTVLHWQGTPGRPRQPRVQRQAALCASATAVPSPFHKDVNRPFMAASFEALNLEQST
jgi:hypothetical protein